MSGVACAVVGGALIGGAATMIAADKNSKAIDKATDANIAATDKSNRVNWAQYMLGRGVDANGNPVNAQLPQWMGVATEKNGSARPISLKVDTTYPGDNPAVTANKQGAVNWTSPQNAKSFLQ